ncbi:MAG: hypothetical protein KDJ31_13360 [Candidatus Competibacteraceae bacterium]|nr:hypothetical protein [Candidatus Competibacteraceae bacterium]HRY15581.1 hypothetical protein [Candidatus Competibacteraceae bacterium]
MIETKISVSARVDALAESLSALRAQGNLKDFTDVVKHLQKSLDLPLEVIDQMIKIAEQEARRARKALGSGMKEAAEKQGCHFDYRPPYISFGCVTFHEQEKNPGTWELSILDGVVIETLSSQNATRLAEAALGKINRIKDALSKEEAFVKNLIAAYEWWRLISPENRYVSPNLLMLLCTYGRGFRKQLTSAINTSSSPLARAEFSYLLARVHRRATEGVKGFPKMEFHGATQHVTKDPFRFIAIPNLDDPCQMTQSQLIAGLALEPLGG